MQMPTKYIVQAMKQQKISRPCQTAASLATLLLDVWPSGPCRHMPVHDPQKETSP